MLAWMDALIAPIVWLHTQFMTFRNNTLYYLNHSSQVVYLEAVLNDRWDVALRRIRVVDGPDIDPLYLYTRLENKPNYIYARIETIPRYIYTGAETINGPDFLVEVPAIITFDLNEMKALINKYRLPSKHNYLIETI